jgi:aminoglycoside phosphotransferase (APT) family kinase protein
VSKSAAQLFSDATYEWLLHQPVPEETLDWVARQVGRGSKVLGVRRMYGGSSTAVHAVDVTGRRGRPHELVLRRFIRPNWKYPGLARREALVLEALEGARYPAPRLVAVDDGPIECDARALLMTRLPGRVELAPKDIDSWLRRIAHALPPVHEIPPPDGLRTYRPYTDPRAQDVPSWSKEPRAWRRVLELARSRQPRRAPRFIHRDYHPGNILWQRGTMSGVVDWISAALGPPEIDVAHCRVNLVRLHGVGAAERFLAHYASATGTTAGDYEPYWDAIGIADASLEPRVSTQLERDALAGLTASKMRRRLDAFAAAVARRC